MFTTVDITVRQYYGSGEEKIIQIVIYIYNLKTFYIHIHGAYLDRAVSLLQPDSLIAFIKIKHPLLKSTYNQLQNLNRSHLQSITEPEDG